jgi:hypothetical protein
MSCHVERDLLAQEAGSARGGAEQFDELVHPRQYGALVVDAEPQGGPLISVQAGGLVGLEVVPQPPFVVEPMSRKLLMQPARIEVGAEGEGQEQGIADLLGARRLGQPCGELVPAGIGQPVRAPRAWSGLACLDESALGQGGQLPIDLTAGQVPEVADQRVGRRSPQAAWGCSSGRRPCSLPNARVGT